MKYLCLAYYDEKRFDALPKGELDAMVRECQAHDEALHKSGHLIAVASLAPTRATTSVRPRNGKPSVTDGPFAETKEQLGGYHVLDCGDLDEALSLARRIPTIPVGGTIEVRPIAYVTK